MTVLAFEEARADAGSFTGKPGDQITREFWAHAPMGGVRDTRPLELYLARPDLQIGQPLPESPLYRVIKHEPVRRKGTDLWDITVTYELLSKDDPLAKPAEIEASSQDYTVAMLVDGDDNPLMNTAGDFLDPIEVEETAWIFSVTKNVAQVPSWFLQMPNRCNLDDVTLLGLTFPAGSLKLKGGRIKPQTSDQQNYFSLGFELHWRIDGWSIPVPNRGFNELVTRDPNPFEPTELKKITERKPILVKGQPPKQPQALDREGKWIKEPKPEDVLLLQVKPRPWLPFSVLPLS